MFYTLYLCQNAAVSFEGEMKNCLFCSLMQGTLESILLHSLVRRAPWRVYTFLYWRGTL